MKIMCRIMERNWQRFQVTETHLYMMNSTEFIAAHKTEHKFTASNYVGAVVNVNCQCRESGWLGIPKWKTQRAYGDASVVCFFFNLSHTSGWHCENGLSLPL